MKVKNNSKTVIEIGHTKIAPGKDEEVEDILLYQPRVQTLRAIGELTFPFTGEPPAPPAPVEPSHKLTFAPAPQKPLEKLVLETHTDVKAPESKVELKEEEERPRSKRR